MATVVKLGGNVCKDPEALDALAAAWLERKEGPWILVHGGGPQADQALAAFGPTQRVGGLRVTPPEAMDAFRDCLDDVGATLCQELEARGVEVLHVPSHWALLHAVKKTVPQGDLGRVGTPTAFETDTLRAMLPRGHLLVVSPIGWDAQGALNVNADEAACTVAAALGARRLVLATDVCHVRGADGLAVEVLDVQGAGDLITSKVAEGGMIPKLHSAVSALEAGVGEVTIGAVSSAWDGSGTRVRKGTTAPALQV